YDSYLRLACIASPISAGLFTTWISAAVMAGLFLLPVSLPPATIAPAWPPRPPSRSGFPPMEPANRFLPPPFIESRAIFLARPPYLTDHNESMRIRVFVEQADCVNEIRADDRISTNTNASRLADFSPRELAHRFISQRSASRNDSDISFKMNMAWHDSDFAL